jgi:hypothetical protein
MRAPSPTAFGGSLDLRVYFGVAGGEPLVKKDGQLAGFASAWR